MTRVDHIFVLMLENRSFDHFFGLSGQPSIPTPTQDGYGPGATDIAAGDPPHEFKDVQTQIACGTMAGFEAAAKLAFEPAQIPVITQLAQEFVLFDNWFSSVPGPTWPNRFFVHAASSGGLATSPTNAQEKGAVFSTTSPFNFQNGSIFDRLSDRKYAKEWRVYHGDIHPQVLAMPGMVTQYLTRHDRFCPTFPGDPNFSDFATDVSDRDYAPAYTFIEPNYAIQLDSLFKYGDSQHPLGRVSAGEALIKYIYEALRNSPLWSSSVLLITWDEHGGFYDHVTPKGATPPGDASLNKPTDGSDPGFGFDSLGVRVPALLVSPLVPRGALGSQLFANQFFDHSSVIKSVFENFDLGAPLTARDGAAPSWNGCLDASARAGVGDGPPRLSSPAAPSTSALAPVPQPAGNKHVDGFTTGMAVIAHQLDLQLARRTGRPPVANVKPQTPTEYRRARRASLKDPNFKLQVVQYIKEVSVRVHAHRIRNAALAKRS